MGSVHSILAIPTGRFDRGSRLAPTRPFPIIKEELGIRMEKKPSRQSNPPQVADSPVADVFENRHPSDAEKKWAEKTLAPTLEKAPERPIGAPTGVNLDEHGNARFTTISGVPDSTALHAGRSARGLERGTIPRLSRPTAIHARHSRHRISRQALHHAPVLRLRLAGGNQPALQVSARARRQRAFRRVRLCPR